VERSTKLRILKLFAPIVLGVGFFAKVVYSVGFSWWLNPWLQRKANREFLDDIKANFYFLVAESPPSVSKPIDRLHSECSTVEIPWRNLLFTFVRWHGETNISVAPLHAPRESYELGPLVAALENRHLSEHDVVRDLSDAGNLLRPRLETLNAAFSEEEFPRIKSKL